MDIKKQLKNYGQQHIIPYLEALDGPGQQELCEQLENIDWTIFQVFADREKEPERGPLSPLGALTIPQIEARRQEFYNAGIEAIRRGEIGAVLFAGGMGTRLGMEGPKGTCQVGVTRSLSIFEQLVKNLTDVTNEAGVAIPLYIMTSEKNDDATRRFFAEHGNFGYPGSDIFFFRQQMAPAVDDEGRMLMESRSRLATSPNGNGGWLSSMERSGALDDAKGRGVRYFNVFAVDNVLQRIADPVFVGATVLGNYDCGAKVVPKADPYEKIGVLCLEGGRPSIVEYYDMGREMAESRGADGELLYRFGVILNYLFSVKKSEQILSESLPYHVVKKKVPYMSADGQFIDPPEPNGFKFETLVLDMVRRMDSCLSFEVVREREFAPIKNLHGVDSLDSARELLARNGVII